MVKVWSLSVMAITNMDVHNAKSHESSSKGECIPSSSVLLSAAIFVS